MENGLDVEMRKACPHDLPEVRAVIARAFVSDPLMRALFPEPAETPVIPVGREAGGGGRADASRLSAIALFYGPSVESAVLAGRVWVAEAGGIVCGAAVWDFPDDGGSARGGRNGARASSDERPGGVPDGGLPRPGVVLPPSSEVLPRPGEAAVRVLGERTAIRLSSGMRAARPDDARRRPEAGWPYLADLAVDPSVQGGGVGGRLLDHCLQEITGPTWLETTNPRNRSFYARHGYEVTHIGVMGGLGVTNRTGTTSETGLVSGAAEKSDVGVTAGEPGLGVEMARMVRKGGNAVA